MLGPQAWWGEGKAPGREGARPHSLHPTAWLGASVVTAEALYWRAHMGAVGRMPCDRAADSSRCALAQCSALSWLLLQSLLCCSLSTEAELCPYPPSPACWSSMEVWDEKPRGVALPWGWAACSLGYQPCWISNTAPCLLPFPSSRFSQFPSSHPLPSVTLSIS